MTDATAGSVAKKLISVIGPMYNEEALVLRYCQEMIDSFASIADCYALELVLVDDGSSDATLENMHSAQAQFPDVVTVVQLSRNFGLEGAIYAGLQSASGDAVVAMDADLQDPPAVVLEMISAWESGADIVVGSRVGRPNDSVFKKISASLFYRALDSLSGKLKLERDAANFRLLDRKAVDQVLALPEVNGVFRVVVPFLGMKTAVVEYERDKRFAGETKYRLGAMIRYALDSLTGISTEPLRKIPYAIVIAALSTLVFLIAMLSSNSWWQPAFMICTVLSAFFALLFLVLGVMAEYLGQTYTEAKARPGAIIYQCIQSQSALARQAPQESA